jgi:hypothetical protein
LTVNRRFGEMSPISLGLKSKVGKKPASSRQQAELCFLLRNVNWLLTDYMALYPRRQNPSYPSLRKPQVLHRIYLITAKVLTKKWKIIWNGVRISNYMDSNHEIKLKKKWSKHCSRNALSVGKFWLNIYVMCRGLCVTYRRVLDWIYWHLIRTTRNYRQYSAMADLHTLQFIVTHALGLSVFTSRILATDLSQSHCNFKLHVKSSLYCWTLLYNHFAWTPQKTQLCC